MPLLYHGGGKIASQAVHVGTEACEIPIYLRDWFLYGYGLANASPLLDSMLGLAFAMRWCPSVDVKSAFYYEQICLDRCHCSSDHPATDHTFVPQTTQARVPMACLGDRLWHSRRVRLHAEPARWRAAGRQLFTAGARMAAVRNACRPGDRIVGFVWGST